MFNFEWFWVEWLKIATFSTIIWGATIYGSNSLGDLWLAGVVSRKKIAGSPISIDLLAYLPHLPKEWMNLSDSCIRECWLLFIVLWNQEDINNRKNIKFSLSKFESFPCARFLPNLSEAPRLG